MFRFCRFVFFLIFDFDFDFLVFFFSKQKTKNLNVYHSNPSVSSMATDGDVDQIQLERIRSAPHALTLARQLLDSLALVRFLFFFLCFVFPFFKNVFFVLACSFGTITFSWYVNFYLCGSFFFIDLLFLQKIR